MGTDTALLPSGRTVKVALGLLLLATLAKGLILSGFVPLWQGPDEAVHFSYVQYIAEEGGMPVYNLPFANYRTDFSPELSESLERMDQKHVAFNADSIQRFLYKDGVSPDMIPGDPSARHVDTADYHSNALGYSPIYYLYGALFYRLAYSQSIEVRAFAIRAGGVLLTLPFVLFVFGFARLLLEDDTSALFLTGFVSFQPMVSFVFGIVNNDGLLVLSATAAFYFMARFVKEGEPASALWLGLWMGIVGLSKPQGYLIVALWPLALVPAIAQRRVLPWKRLFSGMAITAVLCGAWMLFCLYHYGSPLGPGAGELEGAGARHEAPPLATILSPLFFRWPYTLFVSFWGNFGYLDTPIPASVAHVVRLCYLVGFAVVVASLVKTLWRRCAEGGASLFLVALCAVYLFDLALAVFLYPNVAYEGGQGRYYFAVWPPMAGLLFYAVKNVAPRAAMYFHAALFCAMTALYFYAVYGVLLPRYYL